MKSRSPHRHEHIDGNDAELPHHGHINPDYGQRYPPHASSVEDDYDRGVSTQVSTHRNYLKQQQEVFGDTLPTVLNDRWMANAFTELLDTTKKHYRLERARVPLGKGYTMPFTVSGGQAVTHINFVQAEANYQRWPAGTNFDIPGRRLTSVQVFNDGGGIIGFQTNTDMNDYHATNTVTSGTSQTISFMWPVIESLNVVSTSGNCSVRVLVSY